MLPVDFQFSQASLQAYVDCPRRFQLRYVRRVRWPAVEAQPILDNERHLRQGAALHRLIRQHLMGISAKTLSDTVSDAELRRWWHNYLENGPADLPPQRYPELMLSAPLAGHRLVARYDLIAVDAGGQAVIVDWKTNRKRPRRAWLAQRVQTHVYPYLIIRGTDELEGGAGIRPDSVTMLYWFANFPAETERFAYDGARYASDGRRLVTLVEEIEDAVGGCSEGDLMSRTEDEGRCSMCRYRSLCERGIEPGYLSDANEDLGVGDANGLELEFEQIAELEVG
ncbi:MAG: PD-(D/E)XK nuclease family protein [Anaerolineae bacterium]|jgi:CRISPR/Cas system-associated exonuclease Cas4 (RecB family)